MGKDFFDELGVTLTRTAKEFGERAESLYETQKLRGKILSEERAVNRLMADLGKTLYRAYAQGKELSDDQENLCEQIDRHKELIRRCKAEMDGRKGKKTCPSCGESVDKSAAFCPYCGAACPDMEPAGTEKHTDEDVAAEMDGEDVTVEAEPEEAAAETETPGFQEDADGGEAEDIKAEDIKVEAEPQDGEEA